MIVGTEAGLYPIESIQAELEHLAQLVTKVLRRFRDFARTRWPLRGSGLGQQVPTDVPSTTCCGSGFRKRLDEHTNQAGLCAVCGTAFPCDSAVLAEHNVALL